MIQTIYQCDKCGNKQESASQFWNIGVWASTSSAYSAYDHVPKRSMQVCRPCLESFGVHVMSTHPEAEKLQARTTEDILRELLERIGK